MMRLGRLGKCLLPLTVLCALWGMTAGSAQAASKEDLARDLQGRYVIGSVEDLNTFRASLEEETYEKEAVILTADIDCSTGGGLDPLSYDYSSWKGIFKGEFDGGGHKITNYNDKRCGLFPELAGKAQIHDLAIEARLDLSDAEPNESNMSGSTYTYSGLKYGIFTNGIGTWSDNPNEGVSIIRCAVSGSLKWYTDQAAEKLQRLILGGFTAGASANCFEYRKKKDLFLFRDCVSSVDIDVDMSSAEGYPFCTCQLGGFSARDFDAYLQYYECMADCVYVGTIKNHGKIESVGSGGIYSITPFFASCWPLKQWEYNSQYTLYYDSSRFEPMVLNMVSKEHTIDCDLTGMWVALDGEQIKDRASYLNGDFGDANIWNFDSGYPQVVMQKEEAHIPVAGIALRPETMALKVGDTDKLSATVSPKSAAAEDLVYFSSDEKVATVDADGTVKAVGEGTATVTAQAYYPDVYAGYRSPTAVCTVTVTPVAVQKISVAPKKLELKAGEKKKLAVTFTPENATDKRLSYGSNNREMATVSTSGTVTALKAGTATITVRSGSNRDASAVCQVTVIGQEPEKPGTDQPSSPDTPSAGNPGEPSTEAPVDTPSTQAPAEPGQADDTPQPVKVGAKATVGQGMYKVTAKNTVAYQAPKSKKAKVTVPDKVSINGRSYKVTSIAANAFKNNKKLTQVTVGKNIKSIGANAFYGCSNLKKVTIKTTKLKDGNVGDNAFKGIYAKATVKVPSAKLKAYKALLQKKGIGKKTVFKK